MTREEAIKRLKEYAQYSYGIWHNDEEDTKALDMAIEALQAETNKAVPQKRDDLVEVVRCGRVRIFCQMEGAKSLLTIV